MRSSVAIITLCAALDACHAGDLGGGPTISRNYPVGNFQQIEVAGPYDVDVHVGPSPSVSARGSEKLLGRTVVEVQGDKLVIHPERSGGGFFSWSTGGEAHFAVTVPQLSAATLAGSGGIKVDHVQGQSFSGTIAGSGDIDVGAVQVQQLKLAVTGSGDAKVRSGKAQAVEYDVGGSGDLDASGVQSRDAKISVAGSGTVKANAVGTADVNIMGSGDVSVTGGAKCTVSKAGSGSAHCS
jgi:hypothetical protein